MLACRCLETSQESYVKRPCYFLLNVGRQLEKLATVLGINLSLLFSFECWSNKCESVLTETLSMCLSCYFLLNVGKTVEKHSVEVAAKHLAIFF